MGTRITARQRFGDCPSEKFIHKLAHELDADELELLILADKVPAEIKKRIRERPEAFRTLASIDDQTLNMILGHSTGTASFITL